MVDVSADSNNSIIYVRIILKFYLLLVPNTLHFMTFVLVNLNCPLFSE